MAGEKDIQQEPCGRSVPKTAQGAASDAAAAGHGAEAAQAAGSAAPAIQVKGLTKAFGRRLALSKVSFSLEQGAFLSVFGPNGAGKSTLLRLLSTLSRPSAGSIALEGIDVRANPEDARGLIGMLSHAPMLYPDLTAQENLELFARLYGVADPTQRALELLAMVELSRRRYDLVRTFSRGMTQRLSIARALVCDPRILLLDEPYSGLDPHAALMLDDLLARECAGRTCVMVSHDIERGLAACTQVMVLARGRCVYFGAKDGVDAASLQALIQDTATQGVQ